jgi:hypothetical protein
LQAGMGVFVFVCSTRSPVKITPTFSRAAKECGPRCHAMTVVRPPICDQRNQSANRTRECEEERVTVWGLRSSWLLINDPVT